MKLSNLILQDNLKKWASILISKLILIKLINLNLVIKQVEEVTKDMISTKKKIKLQLLLALLVITMRMAMEDMDMLAVEL